MWFFSNTELRKDTGNSRKVKKSSQNSLVPNLRTIDQWNSRWRKFDTTIVGTFQRHSIIKVAFRLFISSITILITDLFEIFPYIFCFRLHWFVGIVYIRWYRYEIFIAAVTSVRSVYSYSYRFGIFIFSTTSVSFIFWVKFIQNVHVFDNIEAVSYRGRIETELFIPLIKFDSKYSRFRIIDFQTINSIILRWVLTRLISIVFNRFGVSYKPRTRSENW